MPEQQSPESIKPPEDLSNEALDLYRDCIDSFAATYEGHPRLKGDAARLAQAYDSFAVYTEGMEGENIGIISATVSRRRLRETDNIYPGEHPGTRLNVKLANGNEIDINM